MLNESDKIKMACVACGAALWVKQSELVKEDEVICETSRMAEDGDQGCGTTIQIKSTGRKKRRI